MIAKVVRGRGFGGLARYLERGPDGARVAWSESRNLPSAHPRDAAVMMRAAAARSPGVQRPVYHLSLAWDPGDPADRTGMVAVADRVLRELGLEDHQVLMVAHADTPHPHLHLMINRVHPETGRAWKGWNDYRRIEEILRPLERELGFREVPGHHARLPGQEVPDRSQALSTRELRLWERTGKVPFAELVREVAGREIAEAGSWTELESRLARHGLGVETRGRGLVVTDGREYLKCSAVAREASRAHLERRFRERYVDYRRERGPAREAEGRDARGNARDRGRGGAADRGRERETDSRGAGAVHSRYGSPGREDRAARGADGVAAGRDRGACSAERRDRGSGGPTDPDVDRVRGQVKQLERRMAVESARVRSGRGHSDVEAGPGQHQIRHALGRSLMALAPTQLRQLEQALTSPQRALVAQAVRTAQALLIERDRER